MATDPDFIPLGGDPDFIPLGAVPGDNAGIMPGAKDPLVDLKPFNADETRRGALKAGATAAGRFIAQAADMINLFPAAIGAISYIGNRNIVEPVFNREASPSERARIASERAQRVREALGEGAFEKWYDELVSQDKNVVNEVLEGVSDMVTRIGRDYESRSGGKMTTEDFQEMFQVMTLGIPAKFGGRDLPFTRKPQEGYTPKLEKPAPTATDEAPSPRPTTPPATGRASPEPLAREVEYEKATPDTKKILNTVDSVRTAEQVAYELMQRGASAEDVRAASARMGRMYGKEGSTALAEALAILRARRENAARADSGFRVGGREAEIVGPDEGPRPSPGVPGFGEPTGSAVGPARSRSASRPQISGQIDARLLAGLGAAGAAALLYSNWDTLEAQEAVSLIGLGALSSMGPKAPLGAIKNAADGTLKTLERLPQNKFEFGVQEIRDQLKRQDVTQAERDAFEAVLKDVSGDRVTAMDLMKGLSEKTEFATLTRKETSEYADYGIAEIGRKDKFEGAFDDVWPPEAFDTAEARLSVDGRLWEIYDADGNFITNGDRTVPDAAAAIERARAANARAAEPAATAKTSLYLSPFAHSVPNHFSEPRYFAHARSFEEDGVRHVVEIQSDLAQRSEKPLDPVERGQLEDFVEAGAEMLQEIEAGRDAATATLNQTVDQLLSQGFVTGAPAWREAIARRNAIFRQLSEEESALRLRLQEAAQKLREADTAAAKDQVRPLLKDWWRRVINEEIGQAVAARTTLSAEQVAQYRKDRGEFKARIAELEKAQEWTYANREELINFARDLEARSSDLRVGATTPDAARDFMNAVVSTFPPEGRARWQRWMEERADETPDFLESPWGWSNSGYVFPKVLREFIQHEMGRGQDWQVYKNLLDDVETALLNYENAQPGVIRFATADTVAKVEGWPEQALVRQDRLKLEKQRLQSVRARIELLEGTAERYRRPGELETLRASEAVHLEEVARLENELDGPRFHPEHQGIYDRYKREIEKYLRTLGGKEVTDLKGITWVEVPLPDSPRIPLFGGIEPPAPPKFPTRRIRGGDQSGAIDPRLMGALATLGLGAWIGSELAGPGNEWQGAVWGAALVGAARLARSRSPELAQVGKDIGNRIERVVGVWSTAVGDLSLPVLRRVRQLEREGMAGTYRSVDRISGFVNEFLRLSDADRARFAPLLFNGEEATILRELPSAVAGAYRTARQELVRLGQEMKQHGLISDLLPGYFPRIVKDYEGLLTALEAPIRDALDKKLSEADGKMVARSGRHLNEVERSVVINRFLGQQRGGVGAAGFTKRRKIGEVTPELLPFYESPEASLTRYVQNATWQIERAKFFGKHLQRDSDGIIDTQNSIANVVAAERAAGRLRGEEVGKLTQLLHDRFVAGERAGSPASQTLRTGLSVSLIANMASASIQLGDIFHSVTLNGLLPTARAVATVLGKGADRVTARDYGLVNHLAEELVTAGTAAKIADVAFKWSGFRMVDLFAKDVFLTAAMQKARQQAMTRSGVERLRRRYGEYFGPEDFEQLIADLQNRNRSILVDELNFAELTRVQPVARSEMPPAFLANPEARVMWTMKSWMLKQLDLVRREVWREFAAGNVGKGTEMALRVGAALYLSNVTGDAIRNWMLGRDDPAQSTEEVLAEVPYNLFKTFGLSDYFAEKVAAGDPLGAFADLAAAPTTPVTDAWKFIMQDDPRVIRNLPIVGRHIESYGTDEIRNIPLIGEVFAGGVEAAVGRVPAGRERWAETQERLRAARERRNDPIAVEERNERRRERLEAR